MRRSVSAVRPFLSAFALVLILDFIAFGWFAFGWRRHASITPAAEAAA